MNIRKVLILFMLLVFVILGCGDDGPSWAGTWSLKSVDGVDWRGLLLFFGATATDKWTFHADGTWDMEMTVKTAGETQTNTIAGTYSLTETTFTMSSPDPGISLDLTTESTESADDSMSVDSEPFEEMGTWILDGDTLTLTNSDGEVLVFEKL